MFMIYLLLGLIAATALLFCIIYPPLLALENRRRMRKGRHFGEAYQEWKATGCHAALQSAKQWHYRLPRISNLQPR
jgi:hypothetical protein